MEEKNLKNILNWFSTKKPTRNFKNQLIQKLTAKGFNPYQLNFLAEKEDPFIFFGEFIFNFQTKELKKITASTNW